MKNKTVKRNVKPVLDISKGKSYKGNQFAPGGLLDRMNANSKLAFKKAGGDNLGNSISAVTGGLSGMLNSVAPLLDVDTYDEEAKLQAIGAQDISGNDLDTLADKWGNTQFARTDYTGRELGATAGQMAAGIGGATTSGAMAGAQIGGPWGAVGGAAAGLLGSTIASINNRIQANRNARYLNIMGNDENRSLHDNFDNSLRIANMNKLNTSRVNRTAYGGPLHSFTGDFSNGITLVGNGGTHEDNPYGGVMVGVDQEGTPNLVEEGEVIWNDYVFSNRLKFKYNKNSDIKIDKKYDGWTFAAIAEDMQNESAERPNDKISRDGLRNSLSRLMILQEEVRMKKEQRANRFDIGGFKGDPKRNALNNASKNIKEAKEFYDKRRTERQLQRGINYEGGEFGGAGGGSSFMIPEYRDSIIRDTLYIPFEQTFNDAFVNARKAGLKQFEFNNKLYNTELGDNPDNYEAGQRRKEVGIIPFEREKKVQVPNTFDEGGPLSWMELGKRLQNDVYQNEVNTSLNKYNGLELPSLQLNPIEETPIVQDKMNLGDYNNYKDKFIADYGASLPIYWNKFKYYNNGKYDKEYLDFVNNLSFENNGALLEHLRKFYNKKMGTDYQKNSQRFLDETKRIAKDVKFGEFHRALQHAMENPEVPYMKVKDNLRGQAELTPNDRLFTPEEMSEYINPDRKPSSRFSMVDVMRQLPNVANLAGAIGAAAKPVDYTPLKDAMDMAAAIPGGSYRPVGPHIETDPLDRNYVLNQVLANQNAQARAAQNVGLNAGQVLGSLQSTYNDNRIADAIMAMDKYDRQDYLNTMSTNASMDFRNEEMRQRALADDRTRAKGLLDMFVRNQGVADEWEGRKMQAINTQLSNALQGVTDSATEQAFRNMINSNPAFVEGILSSGNLYYKNNAKNGGKLNKSKKRR